MCVIGQRPILSGASAMGLGAAQQIPRNGFTLYYQQGWAIPNNTGGNQFVALKPDRLCI